MKDYFGIVTDIRHVYEKKLDIPDEIPDEMPKYTLDFGDMFYNPEKYKAMEQKHPHGMSMELRLKSEFNRMGMFGFVSWRWINPFVKWIGDRKCLEVMAGRGWLSHALRQKGITATATDDYSWAKTIDEYKLWNNTVTEVEKLDAVESVVKYGKDIDILIMSWAYMDDTAYKVIKKLYEVNPIAVVVFIGESGGGCTANDEFFATFDEIKDKAFNKHVASKYQQWWGLHDGVTVGRYNPIREKINHEPESEASESDGEAM